MSQDTEARLWSRERARENGRRKWTLVWLATFDFFHDISDRPHCLAPDQIMRLCRLCRSGDSFSYSKVVDFSNNVWSTKWFPILHYFLTSLRFAKKKPGLDLKSIERKMFRFSVRDSKFGRALPKASEDPTDWDEQCLKSGRTDWTRSRKRSRRILASRTASPPSKKSPPTPTLWSTRSQAGVGNPCRLDIFKKTLLPRNKCHV